MTQARISKERREQKEVIDVCGNEHHNSDAHIGDQPTHSNVNVGIFLKLQSLRIGSRLSRPQRSRRDAHWRKIAEQPRFIEPVIFVQPNKMKASLDLTANLRIE